MRACARTPFFGYSFDFRYLLRLTLRYPGDHITVVQVGSVEVDAGEQIVSQAVIIHISECDGIHADKIVTRLAGHGAQ